MVNKKYTQRIWESRIFLGLTKKIMSSFILQDIHIEGKTHILRTQQDLELLDIIQLKMLLML